MQRKRFSHEHKTQTLANVRKSYEQVILTNTGAPVATYSPQNGDEDWIHNNIFVPPAILSLDGLKSSISHPKSVVSI